MCEYLKRTIDLSLIKNCEIQITDFMGIRRTYAYEVRQIWMKLLSSVNKVDSV